MAVPSPDPNPSASPGAETAQTRSITRFLPVGILVLGLVVILAFDLHRYVSLSALREHHQDLTGFVAENLAIAAVAFMVIYAIAIALSVPGGAILTLAGGLLFGVVLGSVLVVTAATVGAVAVFLAARTALGDMLRRRASGWLKRLEGGFRENAFSYLLTLRLIPIFPFWLVNLAPAFFGVPLATFAITTLLGIIPGTVVFIGVGNGLGATLEAGEDPDLGILLNLEILLPLVGLAVLSLLPVAYRRWRGRAGQAEGRERPE